ncbi:MAG: hypothetical protein ACFFC7_17195 [Candidatus Hermodarchaeota archaeon]
MSKTRILFEELPLTLLLILAMTLVIQPDSSSVLSTPEEEWSQLFGGTGVDTAASMVQTADGGYALAGYTAPFGEGSQDMWLVKTDDLGNHQWNVTYGGIGWEEAFSVVQTIDGGYALAGYTAPFGEGSQDMWLVKTDNAGNLQWNRIFGGTGIDRAFSVIQTIDGGYALAGETMSNFSWNDMWLVKTDSLGNHQWNVTFSGYSDESARSVIQTADGGYALVGYTYSFGAGSQDIWLVKLDSAGSHQWNVTFGGIGVDNAFSVIQTTDGGYALTGESTSIGAGSNDMLLVKTDNAGNHQWNAIFGGTGTDGGFSAIQTVDGGYALVGYTYSFGAGSQDIWLVKTDSAGNHQWNVTFGGTGVDKAFSVIQTIDGGYTLAGYTESFGAGSEDMWLVKMQPPSSTTNDTNGFLVSTFLVMVIFLFVMRRKRRDQKDYLTTST